MVIIGADTHTRSHTVVAVDANGRPLGERTVTATPAGHLELLRWAERFAERGWALEDCRNLSRRLEADLLRAGGREPDLPTAQLDGPEREVRILVDHREDLVAERTRIQNRLRWHLHELLPGSEPSPRSLNRAVVLDGLQRRLTVESGTLARLAIELLGRVRELTIAIHRLEREIAALVRPLAPSLLELTGCGALTAAKLVGETAGAARFRSRAAFARHNGTAPVPVWSGNVVRHRLSRGGNRQLNAAMHRIAVPQLQRPGPGQTYLAHRRAAGDSQTEGIRALRRRISDEVYRRLRHDEQRASRQPAGLVAAA
ncbi:MAG: transposase [Candidatus Limnocylindria bacterium]